MVLKDQENYDKFNKNNKKREFHYPTTAGVHYTIDKVIIKLNNITKFDSSS